VLRGRGGFQPTKTNKKQHNKNNPKNTNKNEIVKKKTKQKPKKSKVDSSRAEIIGFFFPFFEGGR